MGLAASKQEEFWEACGFGHEIRVRRFLDEGVIDVNWVSYTHNSCAIHVASQGKPNIVRMLIDAKCNVNAKDDWGNLPLHHAAMKGHADIIEMLLRAGSELHTPNKNGWTALINAAYWCQPEAIQTLIDNKCDIHMENKDDRTALHEVCRSQSADEEGLARITQMLIDAGCDINKKTSCTNPSLIEADFSPVMFSAYHNHPKITQTLINAKCDLNIQASNGWSALHWAGSRGLKEVVQILLDGGIDPHLQGQRGELAVDRAHNRETKQIIAQAMGRTGESGSSQSTSPQDCGSPSDPADAAEKVVVTDAARSKLQQLLLAQEKRNKPSVGLEVKKAQTKEDSGERSEVSTIYSTTDDDSVHSASRESSLPPDGSPKKAQSVDGPNGNPVENVSAAGDIKKQTEEEKPAEGNTNKVAASATNQGENEVTQKKVENGMQDLSIQSENANANVVHSETGKSCKPGISPTDSAGNSAPLADDEFDESEIGYFDE